MDPAWSYPYPLVPAAQADAGPLDMGFSLKTSLGEGDYLAHC